MKDIVVIYHGNCPDGFGGAWAAWKKFGDTADYFGLNPRDPAPVDLIDKEIYVADMCFPKETLVDLVSKNKKVVIIDHHLSNQEWVKSASENLFDLDRSGAVLAWQYFHGSRPTPKLLQYIEDMDLWQFKLPSSREITTYLELFDFDFAVWSKLAEDFEVPERLSVFIERGRLLLSYENQLIKRVIENHAEPVEFEGIKTTAVNFPNFLASNIGAALTKKTPPIAIVWSRKPGKIVVSLRSDGTVDVSALAAKYGGGGHKASSGFAIEDGKPIPWKPIK